MEKKITSMKVKISGPGTNSAKRKRLFKAISNLVADTYNDADYEVDDVLYIDPKTFELGICKKIEVPVVCHYHPIDDVVLDDGENIWANEYYLEMITKYYFPDDNIKVKKVAKEEKQSKVTKKKKVSAKHVEKVDYAVTTTMVENPMVEKKTVVDTTKTVDGKKEPVRVLSFKQPWAQLICLGLKDAEGRSWDTSYRGRIFIHSSSTKPSKNFTNNLYDEDACEIYNEMKFGNLPDLKKLPTSAIIGYVTLTEITSEFKSVWAYKHLNNWMLEDAYIFDQPITGVNGKLNLWKYDGLDENNLPPAHKAYLRGLKLIEDRLIVPVTEGWFDQILNDRTFTLEWSQELNELLDVDDENEFPVNSVELWSPSRIAIIDRVKAYDNPEINGNGDPILVPDKDGKYNPLTDYRIDFETISETYLLSKEAIIDYCKSKDISPWELYRDELLQVLDQFREDQIGFTTLCEGAKIDGKIYPPSPQKSNKSEKDLANYCKPYGVDHKTLDQDELDIVSKEIDMIKAGAPPFSSILFWKSDKSLKELFD